MGIIWDEGALLAHIKEKKITLVQNNVHVYLREKKWDTFDS